MAGSEDLKKKLEKDRFKIDRNRAEDQKAYFQVSKGDIDAKITYFSGARNIDPWIEVELLFDVDPYSSDVQKLFNIFSEFLEPGSHVMVAYDNDITGRALNIQVPPPATPVGFLMWKAGFRWYKDWYISEGWKEGGQKLQANLPLNQEVKEKHEEEFREKLEDFLEGDVEYEVCRELGQRILQSIRN